MAPDGEPVDLEAVLRAARTERRGRGAAAIDAEARLDELLAQSIMQPDRHATTAAPREPDPLDRFRALYVTTLVPVIDNLNAKYNGCGVLVRSDADKLLSGGRNLTFEIEYCDQGMRMEGTVTGPAVAFQQARYTYSDRAGLTGSGPTLRTRDLDAETFRAFMCDRIASLVRSVLRQHH